MDPGARNLFYLLVKWQAPDCVCEIGAMDARQARIFKSLRSSTQVVAFEPNPYSYKQIASDPEISAVGIELVPKAVTARTGTVALHAPDGDPYRWGLSQATSTRMRADGMLDGGPTIEVEGVRIDDYLRSKPVVRDAALWIRAEGAAHEVLEGMTNAVDRIPFVLVQVERRVRWPGQHLESATVGLLETLGYHDITVRRSQAPQRDLVFMRSDALRRLRARVALIRSVAATAATIRPQNRDGLAGRVWDRTARLVRKRPG